MVGALHPDGLRVVLDVVYNHTTPPARPTLGPGPDGARLLPAADAAGNVETSTCCPNTATEHAMVQS